MKSKSTQIHFLRIILLLNDIGYMKVTVCLNCGTHFRGNYCPHCGQKATIAKLTWRSLSEEFIHFFTHAEHSFVYTTKKIITAPGVIVKEFLDGKRKKVHKPITFLLVWLAMTRLLTGFLNYCVTHWNLYQFQKTTPAFRILWRGAKNQHILDFENLIDILVQAPVLVIVGWGIFRKIKISFVESWVAILYATTLTFIVAMAMELTTFVFRLLQLPFTSGAINDLYLVVFILTGIWIIYCFQKVYHPAESGKLQFLIAVVLAFFAVYTSDFVFYLLYRFIPA